MKELKDRLKTVPPDHLILDSAPNINRNLSRKLLIQKCQDFRGSIKPLFMQFLNLSSSQRDMSGPILGALSNSR